MNIQKYGLFWCENQAIPRVVHANWRIFRMMCSSWMVIWYKLAHPNRLTLSTTGAAMSTMVCTQAMPPVAAPKHPSAAAPAPVVQTQARIEVQNVMTQHSLGGSGQILGHRHHRRRDSLDLGKALLPVLLTGLVFLHVFPIWSTIASSKLEHHE